MNSYYLFLTIHSPVDIEITRLEQVLGKELPEAMVKISDQEFEEVR